VSGSGRTTVTAVSRPTGRTRPTLFVLGVTGLAGCLFLTSCGGGTEVASSTVPTAPPTTAPATIEPAATTAPPTTEPVVTTAPPTTVPATTEPAATTVAPTTAPATTEPALTTVPPTTAPVSSAPATAYLTADDQLREVGAAGGETIRVLDEFFSGEGVFRGGLRLSPDRASIWFSEGYEDSWYSCESSVGSWGRIDAATGEMELIGSGSGIEPSANGEFVSYVTSGVCVPDPEEPDFWVLTPNDRVVVRDLATGEELVFVTDAPPADYAAPSAVLGANPRPGGGLLVLVGDGRLFDVDLAGPSVIQEHPVVAAEVQGDPVSATADALITVDFGDEGSSDVYSVDLASGAPTLLASSGAFMAVGVSIDGRIAVSSFESVTVAPGADVTVIEVPDEPFVFDLDW